jgi:hypothetical protein
MFLTLGLARTLIQLLTSLITYFWLIPVLGYFRAWTAKKMGDSTPEMLGYLTLNPFVHIDMIGLMVLCLFGAGWGVQIPIYLNNIEGRFASLKRLIVLFSDALLSFLIAVMTAVIAIVILGYNQNQLMAFGTQPPSMMVAFGGLLMTTLRLSMFLMIIDIVNNTAAYIVWKLSQRTSFYNPNVQLALMFVPLLIYIFFGPYLYMALFAGISYMSGIILLLFGIK